MHPAVYMTLTKVLIKSDARHSLLLDLLDNTKLYCYIHKITLCSFLTDGPVSRHTEAGLFTGSKPECLCQLS